MIALYDCIINNNKKKRVKNATCYIGGIERIIQYSLIHGRFQLQAELYFYRITQIKIISY